MTPTTPGRTYSDTGYGDTEQLDPLESTVWPASGPSTRRARRAAEEPRLSPPTLSQPALTDRVLALTADRALAVRQLEGYTLPVARRFGLPYEEVVAPASGTYRDELLVEIERIDAELSRRSAST